jgi:uncharacterized protein
MLCDAGPLVAFVDASDPSHKLCMSALSKLPPTTLHTTWPCLTEAMYLLQTVDGLRAQNGLWRFLTRGLVKLVLLTEKDWQALSELMNRYGDMPLDLADASLIIAAQKLDDWKLFSIDSKLRAVRVDKLRWLELYP